MQDQLEKLNRLYQFYYIDLKWTYIERTSFYQELRLDLKIFGLPSSDQSCLKPPECNFFFTL